MLIKSLGSDRPITLFGGVGPTVEYRKLIVKDEVDFICLDCGEETFPKLLENLEANNQSPQDIPNLVYQKDGEMKKELTTAEFDKR